MMNPRHRLPVPAPLLRSVILAIGIVGVLAAVGPAGTQNTGAAPSIVSSRSTELTLAGAPQTNSVLNDNLGRTGSAIAELPLAGILASIYSPDVSPTKPAPVQVATANPSDLEPSDAGRAASSTENVDECLAVDICVDRYLWSLYQRTPKEDSVKELERRKVTVKRKGRMVTVAKTFTKLVDEDFGWKDPKAAERAGMSMMDFVIGGMDRSFKLKLFQTLQAAEAYDLSPGITSAFRDDYRQSIASGLKAASNKSYHGGSSRGGYGHGLAADIVSVKGGTRDERSASSQKLWKWVDEHGKDFGIGRPYLGRDPPHVAPVDGQEYAAHNSGSKHAVSGAKRVRRVAVRDAPSLAKRTRAAVASKMRTS